ncbi:MAG: hypothetical protein I8H75_00015 [Myxococcaceae bacterium]|nr:hypothetical protein [Myxococcaceae bacterium]MBH2005729.1 hypothetical protein [Myxococcaceae bacterium]
MNKKYLLVLGLFLSACGSDNGKVATNLEARPVSDQSVAHEVPAALPDSRQEASDSELSNETLSAEATMDARVIELLADSGCLDTDIEAQRNHGSISEACHVTKKNLQTWASSLDIEFEKARLVLRTYLGCDANESCRLLKHPTNR